MFLLLPVGVRLMYVGDQTRHLNYVNNMLGKWSDCTQFFLV